MYSRDCGRLSGSDCRSGTTPYSDVVNSVEQYSAIVESGSNDELAFHYGVQELGASHLTVFSLSGIGAGVSHFKHLL